MSYASDQNQKFYDSGVNDVSLEERLEAYIDSFRGTLDEVVAEWKGRNSGVKTFDDLGLCNASFTTLDKVVINPTLQRELMVGWVFKILSDWDKVLAMPIMVYQHPSKEDTFLAWDGQHTIIALYIIAKYALKVPLSECTIPIVVSPVAPLGKYRSAFIKINSDAKEPLDKYDLFTQKLRMVRADDVTDDKDANKAHKKQEALESADLFITHSKFGDTDEDGAITRLNEIASDKISVSVIQKFADYYSAKQSPSSVAPKELEVIIKFFDFCEKSKPAVPVTQGYIADLAKLINDRYGNLGLSDNSIFWDQAKRSHYNWHTDAMKGAKVKVRHKFGKTPIHGMIFLAALISHHLNHPVPTIESDSNWIIKSEDLA